MSFHDVKQKDWKIRCQPWDHWSSWQHHDIEPACKGNFPFWINWKIGKDAPCWKHFYVSLIACIWQLEDDNFLSYKTCKCGTWWWWGRCGVLVKTMFRNTNLKSYSNSLLPVRDEFPKNVMWKGSCWLLFQRSMGFGIKDSHYQNWQIILIININQISTRHKPCFSRLLYEHFYLLSNVHCWIRQHTLI